MGNLGLGQILRESLRRLNGLLQDYTNLFGCLYGQGLQSIFCGTFGSFFIAQMRKDEAASGQEGRQTDQL